MHAPPAVAPAPALPPRPRGGVAPSGWVRIGVLGLSLTVAGTSWLALFHAALGGSASDQLPLPLDVLLDSALALPGTLVAVSAAMWLAGRWAGRLADRPVAERVITAVLAAGAAAGALALSGPQHHGFFGSSEPAGVPLPLQLGRDALVALAVLLPVALLLAPAAGAASSAPTGPASPGRRPAQSPAAVWLLVALLMATGLLASALVSGAATGTG